MGCLFSDIGGGLDNVYKLKPKKTYAVFLFFIFIFFSGFSYATDKPTAYASCSSWYSSANVIYKNSYSLGCQESGNSFRPQQPSGSFDGSRYWSFTVLCDDSSKTYFSGSHLCAVPVSCPSPKIYDSSYNTCSNPVCDSPKINDPITGACITPKNCLPPETLNQFNECRVKECTGGQVNSVVTGVCQTPPTCGSTETYDNPSNSCKLSQLRCPGNSHANSTNDECLKDPPLTCPVGMHDDGTYKCIANDAKGCNSEETHGYIFGIPQCIPKPNLDTLQQQAQDAADAKKAAQASANETASALIAAKSSLDADPTNAAKQAAYDNAKSANDAAQSAAGEASDEAKDSTDKADTNALKDIADTVRAIDDRQKLADEVGFGDIPGAEEVETQTLSVVQGSHNVGGSCPSSLSASTSRGVFNISLQPVCDFASLLSPMVVSLAWLAAGFIVFGYKSE